MARHDVYRNASRQSSAEIPYLLDVQADLLKDLASRVVVPLVTLAALPKPMVRLNPVFTVDGRKVVMATTDIAGVPLAVLGPKVSSLAEESAAITGAIDFLLTGA